MMNLNKDTIECATFPTAGSEFLKAMDAHRQGDEPFASAEMGELMRRTDEVLKGLSLEDGAKLDVYKRQPCLHIRSDNPCRTERMEVNGWKQCCSA